MNRGGRGGRGRGRGVTGPRAQARDDDGNVVETKVEGPPPIYPEMELPRPFNSNKMSDYDELRKNFRTRQSRWSDKSRSPFYCGSLSDTKLRAESSRRLASFVTLVPEYFPNELIEESQRKHSENVAAQAAYWRSNKEMAQRHKDATDNADDIYDGTFARWEEREGAAGRSTAAELHGRAPAAEELETNVDRELDDVEEEQDDFLDEMIQDDDMFENYDDDEEYHDDADDDGADVAWY